MEPRRTWPSKSARHRHQGVPRQRPLCSSGPSPMQPPAVNGAQSHVALIADDGELALWRQPTSVAPQSAGWRARASTPSPIFRSRRASRRVELHQPMHRRTSERIGEAPWRTLDGHGPRWRNSSVSRRPRSRTPPRVHSAPGWFAPLRIARSKSDGVCSHSWPGSRCNRVSERWIFSRAERHGNGFFRQPFGATLRAARRRPLSFTIDPGGLAAAIGRAPRRGDVRTDVRASAPFGSRKVQSAAATRRVVAERIWGLWNETRHKPASRQAIFASRPARKCGLLNTILFERRTTGRRQRLETHEIVS